MAGIQSIGVKLVKTLVNGRKVITETTGNKTLTKVFDKYGNLLVDRTKTIERGFVGSKKVITKNETRLVNTYSPIDLRPDASLAFKYKSDRVYDKSGKLLGMRETENAPGIVWAFRGQKNPFDHMRNVVHVTKSVPNGNKVYSSSKGVELPTPAAKSYVKDFEDNKVVGKVAAKITNGTHHEYSGLSLGMRKMQYNSTLKPILNPYYETRYTGNLIQVGPFGGRGYMRYNKKGLPMPQSLRNCTVTDYKKLQDMSLKDMRNEWLKAYNGRYAEYNMNMDFLDIPYHLAKK